jgi:hypothetical protein
MFLCIRNSDNGFTDINTLTYILLHELSHVYSYNVVGHQTTFWHNMNFVKEKFIEYGIYK